MQLGVSAYSYAKLINGGNFSLFDAIGHAKRVGFDAIEFTDLAPPPGQSAESCALELRQACEAAGLGVACYSVQADFLSGSGGDAAREAARVMACADIAKALGAPNMRHDAAWGFKSPERGRGYRDAIRMISGPIREVAAYAEKLGVRTMTENHGHFMQDSARMEALVLAVGHPNYGLLVDIGNFMCADEQSLAALPAVMPYAFHVHAKDFLWKSGLEPRPDSSWFPTRAGSHLRGTVLGHGAVAAAQCLKYIAGTGYGGAVSLEFEGLEDPLEAVRLGHDFMAACLREGI
ncbi:MAG: sugar phosphate isomerase/epimerase [Clostridiales bacterium]|jgi:sugar phosphate isomerase/epimerase|nr:sugar phosphate isomerase/epimerase [Clostridiales bacterium]